jgi:hypothetical protein
MEGLYVNITLGFFTEQNKTVCDMYIIHENRHVTFPLVTNYEAEKTDLGSRFTRLQGPARLATHLFLLGDIPLRFHLKKLIVAFVKNSRLLERFNASIARCFALGVPTFDWQPLNYPSRTVREVISYFNGEYHGFMLHLTQGIPPKIQELILNNQLEGVEEHQIRQDQVMDHPAVGDNQLANVEDVSLNLLLDPVNRALSQTQPEERDYVTNPRRSERVKRMNASVNTEKATGRRKKL